MSLSVGSATGNPRNKTALKPGHSLLDWIRLGNSGADLTGVGGKRQLVSKAQLAEHNKESDCWMCIHGIVYNVTRYMDFHPGGKEELMKGAGIDATEVFNKVHPWVNYESMLQKCIVGKLGSLADEETFKIPPFSKSPTFKPPSSRPSDIKLKPPSLIPSPLKNKNSLSQCGISPTCQDQYLSLVFTFCFTANSLPLVLCLSEDRKCLKLYIKNKCFDQTLEHSIRWPCLCKFNLESRNLQVQFNKEESKLWTYFIPNSIFTISNSETIPRSHAMKVVKSTKINHNSYLIILQYCRPVFYFVPVGYHVFISSKIEDVVISKPYTPVVSLQDDALHNDTLSFIIKSYPNGTLSRYLCSMEINQQVDVSLPEGSFDSSLLINKQRLLLIAAGTGITPMTYIINLTIREPYKYKVQLLFFNKTEGDILLRNELEKCADESSGHFMVDHILSEASCSWNGLQGRISRELLQKYLPTRSSDLSSDTLVLVCGSIDFNRITEQYLTELKYSKNEIFCFSG